MLQTIGLLAIIYLIGKFVYRMPRKRELVKKSYDFLQKEIKEIDLIRVAAGTAVLGLFIASISSLIGGSKCFCITVLIFICIELMVLLLGILFRWEDIDLTED